MQILVEDLAAVLGQELVVSGCHANNLVPTRIAGVNTNNHGVCKFLFDGDTVEVLAKLSVHLLEQVGGDGDWFPGSCGLEELRDNTFLIESAFDDWVLVGIAHKDDCNLCFGVNCTINLLHKCFAAFSSELLYKAVWYLNEIGLVTDLDAQARRSLAEIFYDNVYLIVKLFLVDEGPVSFIKSDWINVGYLSIQVVLKRNCISTITENRRWEHSARDLAHFSVDFNLPGAEFRPVKYLTDKSVNPVESVLRIFYFVAVNCPHCSAVLREVFWQAGFMAELRK